MLHILKGSYSIFMDHLLDGLCEVIASTVFEYEKEAGQLRQRFLNKRIPHFLCEKTHFPLQNTPRTELRPPIYNLNKLQELNIAGEGEYGSSQNMLPVLETDLKTENSMPCQGPER